MSQNRGLELLDATAVVPKASKRSKFRGDIQGLRALAVIAVIADHVFRWPSGGFVGVDVFFVISGYLITGLLLREHDRTGTISFRGFYARRFKRILPAAFIVLATTTAAAHFLLAGGRAAATAQDAVWSLFFAGNWRFAALGTDYFQEGLPPSPLQHFWSLGVEEQFYLVWPWLMLGLFAVTMRYLRWTNKQTRRVLAVAIAAITAASFLWSLHQTQSAPTTAYFSTFSRAWELGLGALLAIIGTTLSARPSVWRTVAAWVGVAGIVVSLLVVPATPGFPAPWAALPVLATVLVIAAGNGIDQPHLWPLTNRVSGYLGDISYSLYLWHFPVTVLLVVLLPSDSLGYLASVLILTFGLSVLSYRFVEDPVRRSAWLTGKEPGRGNRRRESDDRLKRAALSVLAAGVAVLCAIALRPAPAATIVATGTAGATTAPLTKSSLQRNLDDALAATDWPSLTPAIDEVGTDSKATELGVPGCLNAEDLSDPAQCTFNDSGKRSAVVVGDSIAISWMPGVRAALEPAGYKVHGVGLSNCPFANVQIEIANDPETSKRCNDGRAQIYAQIKATSPDLVIVSDAVAGIVSLASGAKDAAARDEWVAGLSNAINQVKGKGTRVVVLSPNPTGKSVSVCYTRLAKPSDCESNISEAWTQKRAADAGAANQAGATYVDASQWFCSGSRCPIFAGGAPIRWDGMHLTEAYSKTLAPQLKAALLSAAGGPGSPQ